MQECVIWVLVSNERILGFMAMQGDLIDQLFVRVGETRKGVGSKLIAKAKELSPAGLRAFTFQKNNVAKAFFEKHGFDVHQLGVSPPPENEPDIEYRWMG